jgi:hypothetical protein
MSSSQIIFHLSQSICEKLTLNYLIVALVKSQTLKLCASGLVMVGQEMRLFQIPMTPIHIIYDGVECQAEGQRKQEDRKSKSTSPEKQLITHSKWQGSLACVY